eukprot:Gb_18299 [translate_table: standard]
MTIGRFTVADDIAKTIEEIILEMHKNHRQHHLGVFLPWLLQGLRFFFKASNNHLIITTTGKSDHSPTKFQSSKECLDGLAAVADGNPDRPVDGVNTIGILLTSAKANTVTSYPAVSAEDEGRDPNYILLACLKTRQRFSPNNFGTALYLNGVCYILSYLYVLLWMDLYVYIFIVEVSSSPVGRNHYQHTFLKQFASTTVERIQP